MILTNHAITGAAIASLTPEQPLVGFALGFISHFMLDSIPHWDYKLKSRMVDGTNPLNDDFPMNKAFAKDFFKIALDGLAGLSVSLLIFGYLLHVNWVSVLAGVVGATLPDALQFVYMKWRREPLVSLQKFHLWIHAEKYQDEIQNKKRL